jgi:hypothetical protein
VLVRPDSIGKIEKEVILLRKKIAYSRIQKLKF